MRKVKELKKSLSLAAVFARLYQEEDAVFLDSSLKNNLGRYSIIGRHPYLKLIKGEVFTANGVEQKEAFEAYVRRFLKENQDENETELPIVSGAVGYFSYEYGRKKEGVKTQTSTGSGYSGLHPEFLR